MSSIPSASSGNGFVGYRQEISVGPHTGFTCISVKCEMGNVVNALDVAWSIALRGIISGNFCKTGESLRMSCSILYRSVGNVVNNSRSRAVTENEVSSGEPHGPPMGLKS